MTGKHPAAQYIHACMAAAVMHTWLKCRQLATATEQQRRPCRVVVENCVRLYRGSMHDDRVQALLTPTVVSHLLGAFELNCVGITVESPVEDLLEEVKTAVRRAAGGGSSTQRAILEVCSLPYLSWMRLRLSRGSVVVQM
jgi:hypothetical protein